MRRSSVSVYVGMITGLMRAGEVLLNNKDKERLLRLIRFFSCVLTMERMLGRNVRRYCPKDLNRVLSAESTPAIFRVIREWDGVETRGF